MFQSDRGKKKIRTFSVQAIKVHNRFTFEEDDDVIIEEDENVKNTDAKEKDEERKIFKSKNVESKELPRLKVRKDKNLSMPKKNKCKTKKKLKSQNKVTSKKNIISLTNVNNKFSIFGYLTEKEIEAIANS